ncbi:glycosyltransferase [Sphaerochaeta globosa]|uniref:Glycosyl transferase family 2 n=1 Tax=Sphaerochaeta globosa (strain ATCC BAA-1886 / DSM 22777 / Buddy) TaxID=158189 RepID=F0RXU4_SPHGB|nr:glycosyltransferase [Sphaerochaeta globosa]ADY12221.1 glycosyl transferase family 2 [Sphaerochaeta globosa str. Buddy]
MSSQYRISVALTTFNGSQYIYEQLFSLLNQTRQPDEVVICDDCSIDNTVEKVNLFIQEHSLFDRWTCYINVKNLGYVENFLGCAQKCTGDIIFFSDQDDVWVHDKVEIIEKVYLEHNPSAVVSTYSMINSEGGKYITLYSLYKNFPSLIKLRKVSLPTYLRLLGSSGKALSFRSEMLEEIMQKVHAYNLTYDTPIGAIALFHDGFYLLHKPLVKFRVHASNTSAPSTKLSHRTTDVGHLITSIQHILKMHSFVYKEYGDRLSESRISFLRKSISMQEKNLVALQQGKINKAFIHNNLTLNPLTNKIFALVLILYGIRNLRNC